MTATELRTLRDRRKLSRARLSFILTEKYGRGFGPNAIESWEAGINPIPSIKAMALREFLD